ncbi:hypothetical protein ALMA_0289 [Alloscardovia macacae]|uniref:Uncharacterized protein n=1 Tax=Alloscardovia macacae TaxID=1160091 RepID=A0A261F796_9BIFI|nr:hypothetical protein ALMA_0289 [Alloscardovia macacae]
MIRRRYDKTELNAYLIRLGMSTVFFLCLMAAVLSTCATEARRTQKIWFIALLCAHYCGYLSLVLLGSGTNIPLAQVGVFLLSGVALCILSVVSICTALRK